MIRQTVQSSNPSGAVAFVIAGDNQARDRQQVLGRNLIEANAERTIIVRSIARSKESWVERRFGPGDVASTFEASATRKSDLETNWGAGIEPRGGENMHATQADIGTASQGGHFFSVLRPKPNARVQRDALAASAGGGVKMLSQCFAHGSFLTPFPVYRRPRLNLLSANRVRRAPDVRAGVVETRDVFGLRVLKPNPWGVDRTTDRPLGKIRSE